MQKPVWLRGVIPAIVTPFREDFSVDEEGLRRYVRAVLAVPGVSGVLCNGYTGEGGALTPEERRRCVAICADEVAGRVPLIAGVDARSTAEAVAAARDAVRAGATVIQVNSPFEHLLRRGFPRMVEAPLRFFTSLQNEVGVPMLVFQYPTWSGLTYPPDVLARLAELPSVVAVKEAVDLDTYVADFDALHGKVALFADHNGYTLLPMLLLGADGTMVGISNVGLELYVELFEAVQRREFQRAVDLTNTRLRPLMRVLATDLGRTPTSFVSKVKEALVMLGRLERAVVRPPEVPVTAGEREAIRQALVAAGLLPAATRVG
ncbi:MAG: dihydrodipicolinate synthase family protein [Armatimonadota bacterium]|nr:dihydrodipicolinate synthase family protein [Armatimonadota bacterium]